jgi:hypothetical protein
MIARRAEHADAAVVRQVTDRKAWDARAVTVSRARPTRLAYRVIRVGCVLAKIRVYFFAASEGDERNDHES